ncbi:MAG: hypothetical protein L0H53_08805 [Candidatus Nitrosocosmicus sp.]|nr:hypothetical protein [Candidatus Nitrosocosmicus sp.]MDN5868225.1 hypothetical protein [Candidatus Nitrosocosmicus sp.]
MTIAATTDQVILRKKLLLSIISSVDRVNSRKKLQKLVYLIDSLGWNVFEDFRFHLYGPYSDHLFYELQNLIEANLIKETKTDNTYSYEITEIGKSLLKTINSENSYLEDRTLDVIAKLDSYNSEDLEIMASLFYISNEYDGIGKEKLIDELQDRKPHLTEDKIKPAFEVFDIMTR